MSRQVQRQWFAVLGLVLYAAVPLFAVVMLSRERESLGRVALDTALATLPMLLLATVTWRLVWPRWKLFAKLALHPCLYAVLSFYLGHWSIAFAWLHQGLFGLGGHIWFSRKHGFTWYAVEDPERYQRLSKQAVTALGRK